MRCRCLGGIHAGVAMVNQPRHGGVTFVEPIYAYRYSGRHLAVGRAVAWWGGAQPTQQVNPAALAAIDLAAWPLLHGLRDNPAFQCLAGG